MPKSLVVARLPLRYGAHAFERVGCLKVLPATAPRASCTYRLPSLATGTASRSAFALRSVSPRCISKCMGLILRFSPYPTPSTLPTIACPPSRVRLSLDGHFLLAPAVRPQRCAHKPPVAAATGYFAWGCFRYFWCEPRRPGTTAPPGRGRKLFQPVAQIVGFGLGRSKILDLSTWIGCHSLRQPTPSGLRGSRP
jgi:hypothetical protein